jgi:hypothetical protein
MLNDLTQGLQPTEVPLGHSPSWVGRWGSYPSTRGVIGVIPQKEPYFPPPVRRSGHGEVEVGIYYMPKLA